MFISYMKSKIFRMTKEKVLGLIFDGNSCITLSWQYILLDRKTIKKQLKKKIRATIQILDFGNELYMLEIFELLF